MYLAVVVQPGTSQIGTHASEQNHSGGKPAEGTSASGGKPETKLRLH